MKIYSDTIFSFTERCQKLLKEIIEKEVGLKVKRTRFELNGYTYPIHVVIFTSKEQLGYFDPHTYQIGLHQNLMYQTKADVLKNILRHEFAHYLCFLKYKDPIQPHGEEYKLECRLLGWEEKVSKASMNIDLENDAIEGDLKSERIIRKVKGLLKLAESSNQHEAEMATLKANQLLLKHNLELSKSENNEIYVHTLLTYKRRSSKLAAIYDILKHFMVKPIFIYGQKQVSLEVSGSKENVELAEYVANFLEKEFENLWDQQKKLGLKGLKAKNSFFLGLAKGYDEKMQNLTQEFSHEEQKALMVIKQELDLNLTKIYRRLSHSSSGNSLDTNAFSSGKKAGKNLTINSAIKNKSKRSFLLNWRQ